MKNKLNLTLTISAILLANCSTTPEIGTKTTEKVLDKGWECLKAPNELDVVGLVFRVNPNGVRYDGTVLDIAAREGEVANVKITDKGNISASLFGTIIGIQPTIASGEVSASSGRKYDVSVSLDKRTESRVGDTELIKGIKKMDLNFIDEDSSYYIIRETNMAEKQNLSVSREIATNFGGKAKFEKALKADGNAKFDLSNESTYEIDQDFGKPLVVCYKAEKFDPNAQTLGVGGTVLRPRLLKEYWVPSTN